MRSKLAAVFVAGLLTSGCAATTPRNGWSNEATAPSGAAGGVAIQSQSGAIVSDGRPTATASPGDAGAASPGNEAGASGAAASRDSTGAAAADGSPAAYGPGVTDTSISISVAMGFSGAYGQVSNDVFSGFQTWVNDVNSRGGIHGRQVEVKKVDHQDTAAGGVSACKEMLGNDTYLGMFLSGDGTANVTGPDCLDKAGRVNVSFVPALDPAWTSTYGYMATAEAEGASLPSYIRSVVATPSAKVGILYLNLPAYSVAKDRAVEVSADIGLDVVGAEPIEPNQGSFVAQLIRLRDAGADTVAIIATLEAVGILRDAKAIGYQPSWTGLGWAFDFVTAAAGPVAIGAKVLRFSATVDAPSHAAYSEKAEAQGQGSALDGEAFLFYGVGQLAEQILLAAGPTFSFEALRAGVESVHGYDNGILPPISWGPGDFVGTTASFPAECCGPNNTWKGLGPARETF
jgi:ABC-type branched-subunit amino acid transport system substrate-binding protein